jgi:hypothetical protein
MNMQRTGEIQMDDMGRKEKQPNDSKRSRAVSSIRIPQKADL